MNRSIENDFKKQYKNIYS